MEQEEQPVMAVLPEPDFEEKGTEEQLAALYCALAEARGKFAPIVHNRTVTIAPKSSPKYTFTYADLDASLTSVVGPLSECGLVVIQPLSRKGAVGVLRTIIAHKGGGRIIASFPVEMAADIKTFGGDVTYIRRYQFNAALCLAADADADDMPDEKRGEQHAEAGPRRTPPPATRPQPAFKQDAGQPAEPPKANGSPLSEEQMAKVNGPVTEEQRVKMKGLLQQLGVTNKIGANAVIHKLTGLNTDTLSTYGQAHDLLVKLGKSVVEKGQANV